MFDTQEALEALVEAAGDDGRPAWTSFEGGGEPDGFVLRHDTGSLAGWRAPSRAWAVGTSAGGTATRLDEPDSPVRCQVFCVVDRWGRVASQVHLADGEVIDDPPSTGRLLDIMLRCLALPTPPAEGRPAAVVALAWLSEVTERARTARRRLGWEEAVVAHPVARILGWDQALVSGCRGPDAPPPARADRAGDPWASLLASACRRWRWEDLRSRCAAAGVGLADVSGELAAWMDEGVYSRWLTEAYPDPAEVLACATESVEPAALPALERLVAATVSAPGPGPGGVAWV